MKSEGAQLPLSRDCGVGHGVACGAGTLGFTLTRAALVPEDSTRLVACGSHDSCQGVAGARARACPGGDQTPPHAGFLQKNK